MKKRRHRPRLWLRLAKFAAPGAIVLGTSCAQDIRKSIVAAGLDFVQGTAGTILDRTFRIDELVADD